MDDAFKKGLALRAEVMGQAEAQRNDAAKSADPFTRDMHEILTRQIWTDIWARPGLPQKVRSMLTVALLASLNRPNQLKMHIKGALNLGVTKEELAEVLMHTGAYCGAPVAQDGFRIAGQVLEEQAQR